jgi:hypothetical protein
VVEQRPLVEREVGRADDGDGVGARLGRVRRERHRVGSRLRPAVDCDREPAAPRLHEQLGRSHPLRDREQDPLAGRTEREQPVDAAGREEVDDRRDGVLVERSAALAKRRHRGRERPAQHYARTSS